MKITFLLHLSILFSSIHSFSQPNFTHYSVVIKGKIVGKQTITRTTSNEYNYTYQYNDRGRGDSIVTSIKTNTNGLISFMKVAGVSYFKSPYKEDFSITGDSAIWVINGERKSKRFMNELYVSGETRTPAVYELLIKGALKQKNKRAALVPTGFLRIGDPVSKAINFNNKTVNLKLVPLYFEPNPLATYVWLTENMQFFALADNWTAVISKGYENLIENLLQLQELTDQNYFIEEVKNNSKQVDGLTVFKNASVFNSVGATVNKNMTIEVAQGKITAMYPSSTVNKYTTADTVIDCKGKFLMPGLWDMHSHYFKENGLFYVAGGVTHVRDLGNEKIVLTYKKQIADNKLLGPDINYLSLLLDKEDQFQAPTGEIIKTLDEGFKAIDEYKALGYQLLKIYSCIDPDWVAPLADYAHKNKMKVGGHIPMGLNAEQCIQKGYDEVTHMNFIFINFMEGNLGNLKGMARFNAVGEQSGKIDLQSEKVQQFIALMKQKNIVLDPTLTIMQKLFDEFKGDTISYLKPVVNWLPETMVSSLTIQTSVGTDTDKATFKASFRNMIKMVKLLYDNGIFLVAGTDGGNANALHHELELYVQAGIPANQVLKIATYNAALTCNLHDEYGQLKTGQLADFILIDGDPIQNFSDIRRVELVIKNHRMYNSKKLLSKRGWNYYY